MRLNWTPLQATNSIRSSYSQFCLSAACPCSVADLYPYVYTSSQSIIVFLFHGTTSTVTICSELMGTGHRVQVSGKSMNYLPFIKHWRMSFHLYSCSHIDLHLARSRLGKAAPVRLSALCMQVCEESLPSTYTETSSRLYKFQKPRTKLNFSPPISLFYPSHNLQSCRQSPSPMPKVAKGSGMANTPPLPARSETWPAEKQTWTMFATRMLPPRSEK